MYNLMQIIQNMLGNGESSGVDQFGANNSGRIMPQGGSPSSSFSKGLMHGMSAGNQPFDQSGRLRDAKSTGDQLAMFPFKQYQDMSQPNYSGMNQFMNFANSAQQQKPQVAAMPPNQYVQALLSGMRGVR